MRWSETELRKILEGLQLRRGDATSVEVKRAAGGVPRMAETICAFANMPDGGIIILGVDEVGGKFQVTGLDKIAEIEARLASMAQEAVHTEPQITFETIQYSGKTVLITHVQPLAVADKPATVDGTPVSAPSRW